MATKSFKRLEQELNEILERVEHGSYDQLDELLRDYEAGSKILAQMEKQLETAKNTITKAVKNTSKEDA